MPNSISSATYDNANRLSNWGGISLTHDSNGNVTSYRAKTYT